MRGTLTGDLTFASGAELKTASSNAGLSLEAFGFPACIQLGQELTGTGLQQLKLVPASAAVVVLPNSPDGEIGLVDENPNGTIKLKTGTNVNEIRALTINGRVGVGGNQKVIELKNHTGDVLTLDGIAGPTVWDAPQGVSVNGDFEVTGSITSSGGYVFPDGTMQSTAVNFNAGQGVFDSLHVNGLLTIGSTVKINGDVPSSPQPNIPTRDEMTYTKQVFALYKEGNAGETKVGIGTTSPERSLHVRSSHATSGPGGPVGSHQGIRLEDLTNTVLSIWDFEPISTSNGEVKFRVKNATGTYMQFSEDGNTSFGKNAQVPFQPITGGPGPIVGSIAIGTGSSTNPMSVNTSNTIGMGLNSDIPTLTITGSSGNATTGEVGIGHIFSNQLGATVPVIPEAKLHVVQDADEPTFRVHKQAGTSSLIEASHEFTIPQTQQTITETVFVVRDTGNVGIGTANPTSDLHVVGNAMISNTLEAKYGLMNNTLQVGSEPVPPNFIMAVDGKAIFEEVEVRLSPDWPQDVVFEDDYIMRTLGELRTYITKEGHLPHFPSAEEFIDHGRFSVSSMHKLQWRSLEEAYLYILELENQQDLMKEDYITLKSQYEAVVYDLQVLQGEIDSIKLTMNK